ncbi:MAG: potassium channel family protein [Bacillota bacterium]
MRIPTICSIGSPRRSAKPIGLKRFTIYAVAAYGAFILGFAGIYLLFMQDYNHANRWQSTLLLDGRPIREYAALEAVYFSAMTTFTIGYGDITPLGWCKGVAIVEGFCGYLAPTLCVAVGLSVLLNNRHDYLRRVRNEQQTLLHLVAHGWELASIRPDSASQRIILALRHPHQGILRELEMERRGLDFSYWKNGYLSSREETSLQKITAWLGRLRK